MHVAIIGAGIAGLSTALFLLREGQQVTLIDPVQPGDEGQASFGNAGLIAISAVMPLASSTPIRDIANQLVGRDTPLFLQARNMWGLRKFGLGFVRAGRRDPQATIDAMTALIASGVDDHLSLDVPAARALIRHGAVGYVYSNADSFAHGLHGFERRAAAGFPMRTIEGDLGEIDKDLSPDFNRAAIFDDHAWIADPSAYMRALFAEIIALGGMFVNEHVTKLDNRYITTTDREVSADHIVITAGALSGELTHQLGIDVPIVAERGYHRFYHGANVAPNHPYLHYDAALAVTPMRGGVRAAGLVEFAPYDAPMRREPLDFIDRRMRELYPNLTYDHATDWTGRRPTLPDSLPVIARKDNVTMAFGGQHLGLTMGPRLGMIARDLVLARRSNIDLAPYDWWRFARNS